MRNVSLNDQMTFSRRSACLAGGGFVALGLAGCKQDEVGPRVVGTLANIAITAYTRSPLTGKIAGYAVQMIVDEMGFFDVKDTSGSDGRLLDEKGTDKYRQLRGTTADKELVYARQIPEMYALVANTTSEFLNAGEVSCALFSETGELLQNIVSREYVNLAPGDSTQLSEPFKFDPLPVDAIGRMVLRTRSNSYASPTEIASLALTSIETLSQA